MKTFSSAAADGRRRLYERGDLWADERHKLDVYKPEQENEVVAEGVLWVKLGISGNEGPFTPLMQEYGYSQLRATTRSLPPPFRLVTV